MEGIVGTQLITGSPSPKLLGQLRSIMEHCTSRVLEAGDAVEGRALEAGDAVEGRVLEAGDAVEGGVATRFRDDFIHGEFTNPNPKLNEKAMDLCKRAIDACRELNGEVVRSGTWSPFRC